MSPNEHGLPEAGRDSVPSIPLSDANAGPSGEPTIGSLVKDATTSMSTLFRAEVALAKAEIVGEAKKAGAGTGLLIVAGVMALYSSFFFFFFLAELLDEFMWRWLAFLIVFLLLVVVTCIAAFVGYIFFKKVRGPKKTIKSVNELQTVLPHRGDAGPGQPAHPRIPPAREG
ncbi:phage holin family protein [Gordonia aurantiaca]|uniref:phage holin family protein n=1 Tax=Gordonia sp. B21 TaxID=3151852 RepID=UPI0032656D42